jgi:hypothetical protein
MSFPRGAGGRRDGRLRGDWPRHGARIGPPPCPIGPRGERDGTASRPPRVRSKRRVGVLVLPRDVADPAVLEHAAAQTEGAFGPLDAWDNNAMVSVFGLVFYNGAGFPERYRDGAFVAQRGSWNRSRFSGYRVVFVPFRDGTPVGPPEDFLTGERTGIRDHARAGQIRSANPRTSLGARPRTAYGRRRAARPTLGIGHVHELVDRR